MQKLSDPPLTSCDLCGGSLKRVISAPGLMFKGSGWYVTDYSDKMKDPNKKGTTGEQKGEQKGGEKGEKSKTTDSGKTEKKTESKGEAKTQPPPKKDSSSK